MQKILIVDDEPDIVNVLQEYCAYNNFIADSASCGNDAIELVNKNSYDCVILDIMMPKLNGFETLKEIKKINSELPIIFCSAKTEEFDKLKGFELGADDYIVKPFSPKEVIARVKAVIKRANPTVSSFNLQNFSVDFDSHKVIINNKEIKLTQKEFKLLQFLINNIGKTLQRDTIIEYVWGWDYEKDMRTLDTHIKTLRKNLLEYGQLIKTVNGVGYIFEKNIQ